MKKLLVILALMSLSAFSGGCAVVPALLTSGASFAVPQTASVAITAVGTAHKTVLIAADERQMDEMVSDKMLTIQAEAILLTQSEADVEVLCLNGDMYVAGEYATPAARDEVVQSLQEIDGVNEVKGVLKQMPGKLTAMVEPAIRDKHAESVINTGLLKELHLKSANVDVAVVQGEAVVMGVVRDAAEAREVVRIVEDLRPRTDDPVKVTSLLALQEVFEAGATQPNTVFALKTEAQMLAGMMPVEGSAVDAPAVEKPAMETLNAFFPADPTPWEQARLRMKRRILSLAKGEADMQAKRELITLSSRVVNDTLISIEGRLVRTLVSTRNDKVRDHVENLLHQYAPDRAKRVHTLAMN